MQTQSKVITKIVYLISNPPLLGLKMGFYYPINHLWNRRSC